MNSIYDKSPLCLYVLIDENLRPSYAKIGRSVTLTENEALIKNRAFLMNRSSKKYIKESEWNK